MFFMIRRIEERDYQACLDIYNYYIENTTITFEEEKCTFNTFSERINKVKENFCWLVYEEKNRILGYAYLDYFNVRSAYNITCDLSIYIKTESIHKGVGSKLYSKIEKEAKCLGFKNIISIITSENDSSKRFHEKMGFRLVGTLMNVGCKFSKLLDVCYYQKEI